MKCHKGLIRISLFFLLSGPGSLLAEDLTGVGSSFVYPILKKWADVHNAETGTTIVYQPIGSSGGIKQIQSQTVDFGATDRPLSQEELDQSQLLQFPLITGAIVPVVNIPGLDASRLRLTGAVLADIYLGAITNWNDARITSLNPDLALPGLPIKVVHRSDGSGSTFIWTNFLSKVSKDWKGKVGDGTSVAWPVGISGKGHEGVSSLIRNVKGSIGYVESSYALELGMSVPEVKNSSGHFVKANAETFAAAVKHAQWDSSPVFNIVLTDSPGPQSWPIAGSTFILLQKRPISREKTSRLLNFFRWAWTEKGSVLARQLHYVPLPADAVQRIEKVWKGLAPQDGTLP